MTDGLERHSSGLVHRSYNSTVELHRSDIRQGSLVVVVALAPGSWDPVLRWYSSTAERLRTGRMESLVGEVELVADGLPVVALAVRSWDRILHWYTVAGIRYRRSVASLAAELVAAEQHSWGLVLRWCSSRVELHRTGTAESWVSVVALELDSLVQNLRSCSSTEELLRWDILPG